MLSEQEFSSYGLIQGNRLRSRNNLVQLVTSLKLTPPVERQSVYRAGWEQRFHFVKGFDMAHFYLLWHRNETPWSSLWKETVPAQNVLELHTLKILVQASSPHGFLRGHMPWNPAAVEPGGTSAKPETLQPQEALTPLLYLSLGWEPEITINLLQIQGVFFHHYQ